MKLTRESIHALFNEGSPNSPQRIALGLEYPLKAGWVKRLIDREIPDSEYERLMALKGPRPKGVPTKAWRSGNVPQRAMKPKQDSSSDIEAQAWL